MAPRTMIAAIVVKVRKRAICSLPSARQARRIKARILMNCLRMWLTRALTGADDGGPQASPTGWGPGRRPRAADRKRWPGIESSRGTDRVDTPAEDGKVIQARQARL